MTLSRGVVVLIAFGVILLFGSVGTAIYFLLPTISKQDEDKGAEEGPGLCAGLTNGQLLYTCGNNIYTSIYAVENQNEACPGDNPLTGDFAANYKTVMLINVTKRLKRGDPIYISTVCKDKKGQFYAYDSKKQHDAACDNLPSIKKTLIV